MKRTTIALRQTAARLLALALFLASILAAHCLSLLSLSQMARAETEDTVAPDSEEVSTNDAPFDSTLAAPRKPNFIFLLADDMRWDAWSDLQKEQGSAGRFPWMRNMTPNIDRLASEGVRFNQAFVVSSLCSPSRAAFLTGQYNHNNTVVNNHMDFPTTAVTHASFLKARGYKTGYFGKWHMGTQRARPGFSEYASYVGQGNYFNDTYMVNGVDTKTTGWVDDVTTNYAIAFIRKYKAVPFSMVVGFKSPHHPWTPAPRFATAFPTATLAPAVNEWPLAPYLTEGPCGFTQPQEGCSAVKPTAEELRDYFRTILGVDDNLGRILSTLDSLNLANDTVVVFASDNGYLFEEHGLTDKRAQYEESIRIPLLMRYPRLNAAGETIDSIVLNIDLAPTFIALAGYTKPTGMQGFSWLPLITGTSTGLRANFLYEYFYETPYTVPTVLGVRGDYSYITYPGHPTWTEIYDMVNDPLEFTNLASHPALLSTMQQRLNALKTSTKYHVPPTADTPP